MSNSPQRDDAHPRVVWSEAIGVRMVVCNLTDGDVSDHDSMCSRY